jgi:eukaryotic-like serine/threonine-protein kinase
MIGTTVGKYRIVDKLGRGGMGTVYKAVDETLDREVAIKVLNPDLTDAAVLKRFRAEAVTLARLNHPGIATIYELHHQQDDVLMVMEFVRGETFHDLSDRLGPLAPPQAAHLCMQVLDALGHAHRAGVVHRDLKPANVMITDSGAIKVMDFGIARVLGSEHFTHGGYMMGTPAYMAPEQVLGREIDGRADLYSVGVVLYRLLSGRLPFNADTAISMVQMQISEPPTPILSFKPDLPAWCTSVIDRALAKSPSGRYQSADEFRSALLAAVTPQALGEMPTLATPTPPGLVIDHEPTEAYEASTAVHPSAVAAVGRPVSVRPAYQAPAATPTPTATPQAERTGTTVVLGRTHLAAIGALVVIVAAGIALLAFAALRSRSSLTPAQIVASQNPNAPPAVPTVPPTPATPSTSATPQAPAASSPTPTPSPTVVPTPAKPSAGPGAATTGAPPPAGVSTLGAGPAGSKPGVKAAGTSAAPESPSDPNLSGRGATPATKEPLPPPPAAPMVSFNEVRVLVNDGERSREREGVLQIGDGRLTVTAPGSAAPIVSMPTSSLNSIFYARSRQPKWRDASGKEVESRADLGRMGFLRGERNWLILLTSGEPVILRIEDSALRTVLTAIEERTGRKVQR